VSVVSLGIDACSAADVGRLRRALALAAHA
jgi:hypothetical protein